MSIILNLLLIGISLSMDTFSISLSIGTFNISKKKLLIFSGLVGVFHFFMPLIGNLIGYKIINFLDINVNFLLGIILLFIGIEMLIELKKDNDDRCSLEFFNMLIISLSVSLDSFSTGIGISAITNEDILSGFIFSICAFSFTLLGLIIGKYCTKKLGIIANIMGIVLLILLGIIYIFK